MKFVLIIDGSFLLHRSVAGSRIIKKGSEPFDFRTNIELDTTILLWKLSQEFSSLYNKISHLIDRVIWVEDGHSWRKNYHTNSGQEYKGNRNTESELDWNEIRKVYARFTQGLSTFGVEVSRVPDAEADDLIWFWSEVVNTLGYNCIVATGDYDLNQLVKVHNQKLTAIYNIGNEKVFLPKSFVKWAKSDSEDQIGGYWTKVDFVNWIKNRKDSVNSLDPCEFVFQKALVGDSGDNIPSIIQEEKITKAGERKFGIGPKTALKIISDFISKHGSVSERHLGTEYATDVIDSVYRVYKKVPKSKRDDIINRWNENVKMVWLHGSKIPKKVMEQMHRATATLPPLIETHSGFVFSSRDSILENLKWNRDLWINNRNPIMKTDIKTETVIVENSGGFDNSWDDLIPKL